MPFVQVGTYPTRNFARFGWETYGFPLRCSPFPFNESLRHPSDKTSLILGVPSEFFVGRLNILTVASESGLYLHPTNVGVWHLVSTGFIF